MTNFLILKTSTINFLSKSKSKTRWFGWFKIDTPVGKYNPDWAVAFDGDKRIYFVAGKKGSDDINDNHLSVNERSKLLRPASILQKLTYHMRHQCGVYGE